MVTSAGTVLLAAPELPSAAAPAVTYTLQVSLNPGARRLDGRGRVRWRNTSASSTDELRLSLYYNARADARADGAMDITSLRLTVSDRDVLALSTFADAGNRPGARGTMLRVPLGESVPPGEEVSFDVGWVARVPADAAIGGVTLLAHWFPQVVAAGDHGTYDVTMDVPPGWGVAATGREETTSGPPARATHRFVQDNARDFVWAASGDWTEQRTRVEREGMPSVDVRLLARPEHAAQLSRMTAAAAVAIRQGKALLAAYPYADLTVLDLPWGSAYADAAYPGLVTIAARWLAPMRSTELESELAAVLAKHYWQQAVGVDGVDRVSMSEGFVVYSAERLGAALVQHQLDSTIGDGFLVQRLFGGFVPYVNRSVRFNHAAERASPQGKRVALALSTLERYLGWPTLEMVLDEFATRFRFRQPTLDDFARVATSVSGRDLRWFFDGVFRDGLAFDYAVERVTPENPSAGAAHRTSVVVARRGEGIFSGASRSRTAGYESGRAIEVEVAFADGSVRREHWDGRDRRTAFVYESAAAAERVDVDPDRVLRLDTARTNNSWTRASRASAAAARWSGIWLIWLEDLLLTYAALV